MVTDLNHVIGLMGIVVCLEMLLRMQLLAPLTTSAFGSGVEACHEMWSHSSLVGACAN